MTRPRGKKMPMPVYTCPNCNESYVGRYVMTPHLKMVPDGTNQWGNPKYKSLFLCGKCGFENEWVEETRRVNRALARGNLMQRTWGCSGIQRRYR
jgi:predicted RNA-binding Zn-ribbon protein involved in translation (DUF1610 family)